MVHGCGKKQWVVPVLEKIEMANTQGCPSTGGQDKQNTTAESGKCGQGMGS
jgi:hypothetical protein